MLLLLLVLAAVLVALLVRAPQWLNGLLIALCVMPLMWLVVAGGAGRTLAPLLALAIALGLLIPGGNYLKPSQRVAPARHHKRRRTLSDGGRQGKGAESPVGVEAVDIPGYETLEKVGSGGMASVYRARRKSDGQIVALKVPMEQYVADAKFIRRFHREAEVAQRLDHPNIVRTYDHGSVGIKHYMVMEFVDGRSLEAYIEAEELNLGLAIEVMKSVVRALQHIHSVGIIHRDIKPANIMILRGGIRSKDPPIVDPNAIKLMDFGIAGGKVLTRLTMTGARVGTPVYMSPEQARGLKIDHRSDIYSLGLVFYETLTGQTAFKGGYEAIVHQQIFQTPPPPRQLNLSIPKAIDALVMRMIAKDPDARPTLEEVLEVLNQSPFDDDEALDAPSRILLTVSARQGVVRLLDTDGVLHSSIGNIGIDKSAFSAAPLSVALDSAGNLFAAIFEYRVGQEGHQMIHKLDPKGNTLATFGAYGMKPGEFLYPISLCLSPDDRLYVLDSETHQVQCFDTEGRYQFSFGGRGYGRGTFNDPRLIVSDHRGLIYVLDYGNRQIQRFDGEGRYQTRWAFRLGADQQGMRLIDGVTVDRQGNLYISDATSSKVRKVSPQGKVELSYPIDPLQGEATDSLLDLGVDDQGFLYAARRGGHLIRKFDPSGRLVTTMETYAPVVQMVVDVRLPTAAPALLPKGW